MLIEWNLPYVDNSRIWRDLPYAQRMAIIQGFALVWYADR